MGGADLVHVTREFCFVPRDLNADKRIGYVDSLKGFAIILVVLGHICAGYNAAQAYPSAKLALTAIHRAIYMFHMPLFMTISGYVFRAAYFTDVGEPRRGRIFRQALDLLLTCFLFSAMLGCFKMVAAGYVNSVMSPRDILLIPVRPVSPYWYLYVLAIFYFTFSAGMARLCRMRTAILLPMTVFLSAWGSWIGTNMPFELGRSLFYSFFFALGIALRRHGWDVLTNSIATSIFGVCAGVLAAIFWHGCRGGDAIPLVNLALGTMFTFFFWGVFSQIQFFAGNRVLRFVGRNSLEIYLLHCIFTAGNRTVLSRLGVGNAFVGTSLNLIISVLLPMLFGIACKRLGVHGFLFKPVSWLCHKHSVSS